MLLDKISLVFKLDRIFNQEQFHGRKDTLRQIMGCPCGAGTR